MKSGNRDRAEGTFHKAKGKIKEEIGQFTDNPDLEAEGVVEKTAGDAQKKMGKVKKALGK